MKWPVLIIASCALTARGAHAAQYLIIDLTPYAQASDSFGAQDVNRFGTVCGSFTVNGVEQACIWEPDPRSRTAENPYPFRFTVLGKLTTADTSSRAYALNDSGDVVGFSQSNSLDAKGFLWNRRDSMVSIGNLGFLGVIPYDINDDGTIVGQGVVSSTGLRHAFSKLRGWPIMDIHPAEAQYPGNSAAKAISNSGLIAGIVQTNGFELGTQQAIWANGTATLIPNAQDSAAIDVLGVTESGATQGRMIVHRPGFFPVYGGYQWSPEAGFSPLISYEPWGMSRSGFSAGAVNGNVPGVRYPSGTFRSLLSYEFYSQGSNEANPQIGLQFPHGVSDNAMIAITGSWAGHTAGGTQRAFLAIPIFDPIPTKMTVSFPDLDPLIPIQGRSVEWEVRKGKVALANGTAVLDSEGSFTFMNPIRGEVTVSLKANRWLRKNVVWDVAENATAASASATLICGDCNDDNHVDASDYFLLSDAYDTAIGDDRFDPRADINEDGAIDAADYFILSDHYDMDGDE